MSGTLELLVDGQKVKIDWLRDEAPTQADVDEIKNQIRSKRKSSHVAALSALGMSQGGTLGRANQFVNSAVSKKRKLKQGEGVAYYGSPDANTGGGDQVSRQDQGAEQGWSFFEPLADALKKVAQYTNVTTIPGLPETAIGKVQKGITNAGVDLAVGSVNPGSYLSMAGQAIGDPKGLASDVYDTSIGAILSGDPEKFGMGIVNTAGLLLMAGHGAGKALNFAKKIKGLKTAEAAAKYAAAHPEEFTAFKDQAIKFYQRPTSEPGFLSEAMAGLMGAKKKGMPGIDVTDTKSLPQYTKDSIFDVERINKINADAEAKRLALQRQDGLIGDLQRLIDEQKGAGPKYGPIKRELQAYAKRGEVHPSILAEMQRTSEPPVAPLADKPPPKKQPVPETTIADALPSAEIAASRDKLASLEAPIKQPVKETVKTGAPVTVKEEFKKIEPPRPPMPDMTGPARRFVDQERVARGLDPLPAQPKSPQEMAAVGEALLNANKDLPESIWQKVMIRGEGPTLDDASAAHVYRDRLAYELNDLIKQKADPSDIELKNLELDKFDALSSQIGSQFHGLGMAQQIAHSLDDMSFAELHRTGRAMNFNADLPKHYADQLSELSRAHESLKGQLAEARAKIDGMVSKMQVKRGSAPAARRREVALTSLQKLGFQTASHEAATAGGIGKQAGVVRLGTIVTTEIRDQLRKLAGSYRDMGHTTLESMLEQFRKDLPGTSDDVFLSALSSDFKRLRTEADLKRAHANRIMGDIGRHAAWRMKSVMQKAAHVAEGIPNTLQRGLLLSFDLSSGLLQGKVALLARPGSWIKAWGPTMRALFAKTGHPAIVDGKLRYIPSETDAVAAKLFHEVQQTPGYDRLVKAGFSPRELNGSFTAEEEFFRDHQAIKIIPGIARSDSAFSAWLNAAYVDWGRKEFAAADKYQKIAAKFGDKLFDAEAYDKDIAAMLNIASGRGHGKVAQWLGARPAGVLALAPRYAWSGVQFATGVPLFGAKTTAGKLAAASMYTRVVATVYGATLAAKHLFGWDVDTDTRSDNFGMVTTPEGWRFDLYNKLTEFTRLPIKVFYGKVGDRGQYSAPGDFGFDPIDDYVSGRMISSPLISDIRAAGSGQIFDPNEGRWRDATPEDLARFGLPLSWQNVGTHPWYAQVLDVLGGRVKPAAKPMRSGDKPAPELDLLNPVGLKKWFGK